MIRLVGVELRRDLARRVTRLLVVAFLGVVVLGTLIAFVNVDTYSDADIHARQELGMQSCIAEVTQFGAPTTQAFDETETGDAIALELQPVAPEDAEATCRELLEASLTGDNTQLWYFDDPRIKFTQDLWNAHGERSSSILISVISMLMICGMAAGASMVGAEWKFGTITTQLTWDPRRIRLFTAKLLAAAIAAFAIAVALQAAFGLMIYPLYAAKGVTAGMDADWYTSLAGAIARGGLLTSIGAVLGASLAMLMRNTAGAIIVVFGYMAVVENLVRAVRPNWAEWLIGENMTMILTGRPLETVEWEHTVLTAGLTLVGYVALLACAAGATFHQRDIAGSS